MADQNELRDPWLVAAWPGMGSVALAAGAYLVDTLNARLVHELPARDQFDVQQVEVKKGLAAAARMPRSMFFEWRDPDGRHDLLIFLGEAQPDTGGYAFCHRLLDYATQRGVRRLFTFAAMATQLHPSNEPRVFGVGTQRSLLSELREHGAELLEEGQISGLNGVLLAAGAERGIPGVCLLGELPFFAVGVPNPRASQAVLEVFSDLSGIDLDLDRLKEQADAMQEHLLDLLEHLKEAARRQQSVQAGEDEETFTVPEFVQPGDEDEEKPEKPKIDAATRRRIEQMFEQARRDQAKAFELKEELDRLGVFKDYEDRFLDLFKKGE